MARKKSWTDFITTENIEKGFSLISGGLDILSSAKDMLFSNSNDESINDIENSIELNHKIDKLEKEKVNLKYELLEAMNQTLIFRCAIVEMEKQLSGSFFAKLGNLFKSHNGFVGDKIDEFIANNAELEKILHDEYGNIKAKAKELDIELPQEDKLTGDLA